MEEKVNDIKCEIGGRASESESEQCKIGPAGL